MLLFGGVVVKVVLHLNLKLQALSLTSNTSSKLMSPWHLFSVSDHDIVWYQVSKQIVGYHNTGHGFLVANLGTVNCSEWKVSFESFFVATASCIICRDQWVSEGKQQWTPNFTRFDAMSLIASFVIGHSNLGLLGAVYTKERNKRLKQVNLWLTTPKMWFSQ